MAKTACVADGCPEERCHIGCELCGKHWCVNHAPKMRNLPRFDLCPGCGAQFDALPDNWKPAAFGRSWADLPAEIRVVLQGGRRNHAFWYDLSKVTRGKRGLRAALVAYGMRTKSGRVTEAGQDVTILHSLSGAGGSQ